MLMCFFMLQDARQGHVQWRPEVRVGAFDTNWVAGVDDEMTQTRPLYSVLDSIVELSVIYYVYVSGWLSLQNDTSIVDACGHFLCQAASICTLQGGRIRRLEVVYRPI